MGQLMSHFGPVNDFYMDPPTPPKSAKLQRIVIVDEPEMFSNSFDDSSFKSANEFSCSDDSDSEMEVPDFDMDFSFEVNVVESNDADISIIQEW
jgi:hypothetical protein